MEIKPNIETLIEKSGLRKKFIADKLGVSTRQLRKYETGQAFIPMEKAFILARLLGVKVDDLYIIEEEET